MGRWPRGSSEAITKSKARFRDLTELSSDWYWEMGPDLRFTDIQGGKDKAQFVSPKNIGKLRWELPYVAVPDSVWAAHQDDLAAHRPFHDLILKRQLDDGGIGVVSIISR